MTELEKLQERLTAEKRHGLLALHLCCSDLTAIHLVLRKRGDPVDPHGVVTREDIASAILRNRPATEEEIEAMAAEINRIHEVPDQPADLALL